MKKRKTASNVSILLSLGFCCLVAHAETVKADPSIYDCVALEHVKDRKECVAGIWDKCLAEPSSDSAVACYKRFGDDYRLEDRLSNNQKIFSDKEMPSVVPNTTQNNSEASFGIRKKDVDQIKSISAEVVKVEKSNSGIRRFYLSNGQLWREISPEKLSIKTGDTVTIKRGGLGSFNLRKKGVKRFIKVRRLE